MGQAYQDGLGIEQNPAQARDWHQKAAAGYVQAPNSKRRRNRETL
ncbi:SEL1-like repeat protein [Burkholderia sp. PAMC 26561]